MSEGGTEEGTGGLSSFIKTPVSLPCDANADFIIGERTFVRFKVA